MLYSAACPFVLWAFSSLERKPFISSKEHVGQLQKRKHILCACRHIGIADKQESFKMLLSPCWGLLLCPAEWVGIMSVLHHCTACQVTSKRVWWWVQLSPLPYTPAWALSNSLLTWKAGDLQLVMRGDQTEAMTSSTIAVGSGRNLVAGPCYLCSGTVSLHCTL